MLLTINNALSLPQLAAELDAHDIHNLDDLVHLDDADRAELADELKGAGFSIGAVVLPPHPAHHLVATVRVCGSPDQPPCTPLPAHAGDRGKVKRASLDAIKKFRAAGGASGGGGGGAPPSRPPPAAGNTPVPATVGAMPVLEFHLQVQSAPTYRVTMLGVYADEARQPGAPPAMALSAIKVLFISATHTAHWHGSQGRSAFADDPGRVLPAPASSPTTNQHHRASNIALPAHLNSDAFAHAETVILGMATDKKGADKMWGDLDCNGNGIVSMAELDKVGDTCGVPLPPPPLLSLLLPATEALTRKGFA